MMNPTIWGMTNHMRYCALTMSPSAVEPARISTPITDIDIESSYEIICAVERTEPSNGNFEPEAQPANEIPYTPIEVSAKMNRMPAFTFPTDQSVPSALAEKGMIAKVPIAQISEMNGPSR